MKHLETLIRDAGVVEVRHLPSGESGRFDDAGKLVHALGHCTDIGNLYTTLNRPFDQDAENAFGTPAYSDCDIGRIVRFLSMLTHVRQERGYQTGWIAHRYKRLYQTWPEHWWDCKPMEPSPEFDAWMETVENLRNKPKPEK